MTLTLNEKLRRAVKYIIPAVLTVSAVLCALFASDGRKYAIITVISAVLSIVLFYVGFDKRRIGSRRLILGAVFTALGIAGRFIPVIKPTTALIIIAGMYAGPETGFLVGSMSALLSNIWFGQGPWTPMQMVALGLIGFFAGILREPNKRSRLFLYAFGVLCGIFYSMFLDIWSTCSATGSLEITAYLRSVYYALPFTASYALSNVIFLILLAKPFGVKLQRVSEKYGL